VIAVAKYHDLSVAEKAKVALSRQRESSVPCPGGCGTSLMPADLLSHIKRRCEGRPAPGPSAKWASHAEALKLGVTRWRLWKWCRPDRFGWIAVRVRIGHDGYRQYLLGDLQIIIAKTNAVSVESLQTQTEEP
jgi:hypothetical protein